MSELQVVWEDPPPRSNAGTWAERLEPIRSNPGQWARILEADDKKVQSLRSRLSRNPSLRGQYEFRTHKADPSRTRLYVRFKGSSN